MTTTKDERRVREVIENLRDQDLEYRHEQLELTVRDLEHAPSQQARRDLCNVARRQILELNRNRYISERGRRWLLFVDDLVWGYGLAS